MDGPDRRGSRFCSRTYVFVGVRGPDHVDPPGRSASRPVLLKPVVEAGLDPVFAGCAPAAPDTCLSKLHGASNATTCSPVRSVWAARGRGDHGGPQRGGRHGGGHRSRAPRTRHGRANGRHQRKRTAILLKTESGSVDVRGLESIFPAGLPPAIRILLSVCSVDTKRALQERHLSGRVSSAAQSH